MESPEQFAQFEEDVKKVEKDLKESLSNEEKREQKGISNIGAEEIISELETKDSKNNIKAILEDPKDYTYLFSSPEIEKKLKELGDVFGEDSPQVQISKQRRENFHNDFIKYLRADKKFDSEYVFSRRVTHAIDELEKNGYPHSKTEKKFRELASDLNNTQELLDTFGNKNPEIFVARHLKELRDYKKELAKNDGERGRIVETPYVKKQLAEVEAAIIDGKPIFIHGHLGSGKTEMALRASYNYIKENKSQEEINNNVEKEYDKWIKNHPEASDDEKNAIREDIEKESKSAVVISGSKETTISDFAGHRTLNIGVFEKLAKKLALNEAQKDFEKWIGDNPNVSEEQQIMQREGLLKVYLEKNGGTFSDFYVGPIYRAMEQGRPVIIDEADAIPHDALVFLNHIMTRKAGDTIPVQGDSGERVTVKEGFSIILTGNFPKIGESDLYVGRKDMDAAFLSRLIKLEHDYLPQTIEPEKDFKEIESKDLENSELFHLLVAKVMKEKGDLEIPKDQMTKLWRLACFSRHIQDIFSSRYGKLKDSSGNIVDDSELKDKLHKEVLSMRQLLTIIDKWTTRTISREKNEGLMQYELDHHVFEYFIKTTPEEETKWELYKIAQDHFGLFQAGWDDSVSGFNQTASAGIVPKFDISSPKNKAGEFVEYTKEEVVEMCFGELPKRDYSGIKLSEEDEAGADETQNDIEKEKAREEALQEMQKEFEQLRNRRK